MPARYQQELLSGDPGMEILGIHQKPDNGNFVSIGRTGRIKADVPVSG